MGAEQALALGRLLTRCFPFASGGWCFRGCFRGVLPGGGCFRYVFLGNYLGLPGVSVPVGFDRHNNGMPVGLMFSGPHWSEDRLLKLASYFRPLPAPKFDASPEAGASLFEASGRHGSGGGGGGYPHASDRKSVVCG